MFTVTATTAISPTAAVTPRASERRPPAAVAALPDMPKPVTPATPGVHLMRVPSSRVIEVLASLQRALGQQVQSAAPPEGRAQQWAKAIAPVASGVKVDIQA